MIVGTISVKIKSHSWEFILISRNKNVCISYLFTDLQKIFKIPPFNQNSFAGPRQRRQAENETDDDMLDDRIAGK